MFSEGNLEGSKRSATGVWPVLNALLLVTLLQVGHHDDGGGSLLPHKPPEISDGPGDGACMGRGVGYEWGGVVHGKRAWAGMEGVFCK